jgi:hypothetical protein
MNRKAAGPAAIIAAALAMLATACSGGPGSADGSSGAGRPTTSTAAVAYSHCIRSHGVPDYPDPASNGRVPKADPQQLGVSSSQLQAAQRDCQHLYPANGGSLGASLRQCEETGDCPQAMVQQVVSAMRIFSRCMRSHGVPNWPDPTVDSEGRPGFNLVPIHGTNWNSPYIQNKIFACEHVMPAGGGVPAIYPA